MKLADVLLEKSQYVIDRDDFIFLHSVLKDKYAKSPIDHCFLNAVVDAIRIVSDGAIKVDHEWLENIMGTSDRIHYNDVVKAFSKKAMKSGDKLLNIDLKLGHVSSAAGIKKVLQGGEAVIVVVQIHDSYWDFFGELSGWRGNSQIQDARDKFGDTITDEFQKKVDSGLIPYPSDAMIDKMNKNRIFHAIVCVGYDAGEKAFICKDNIVKSHQVKFEGLFKLDEKFFFDKKLKSMGLAVVHHAISLDAEITKESSIEETAKIVTAKLESSTDKIVTAIENGVKRLSKEVKEELSNLNLRSYSSAVFGYMTGEVRTYQFSSTVSDMLYRIRRNDPSYYSEVEKIFKSPLTSTRPIDKNFAGIYYDRFSDDERREIEDKIRERILGAFG